MERETKHSSRRSGLLLFLPFLCLLLLSVSGSADAYKNYTVGGTLGWFDNTENSKVSYQKWADGNHFSLGDFLIFNTDNNHSVVQTYNLTTYNLCDYNNALDSDTFEWSTSDPSNTATHPTTVAVPLLKEGLTYFFSGNYDGDQCKNGQHFKINVTHGQGLPESLKSPAEQAPAPNSPDISGDDSVPDTIVPTNFDHPDRQDESDSKGAGSASLSVKSSRVKWSGVTVFLGIVLLF